jgi:AraC-like DNA-binding protein
MKEKIASNKIWLRRLLLSYVSIFLFIVPLLMFALLMAFSELSRKNAIESNAIFTKQVLQSVDNQLQLIDNSITNEIAADETLLAFFNPSLRNDRYYSGYLSSVRVKNLMATMPLIDSIYMYRLSDGTVQTPYSVSTLDAFIDKQAIADALKQPVLNRSWSNVRKGYTEQSELTDYISLARNVPLNSGNDGVIIVNVKLQTLSRFVQTLTTANSNHIRINDRSGSPIYHDSGDSGSVLTNMPSDYTGWTISSGIADGNVFRFVSALSNYWLAVCIVFFLCGALWVVVVSKTKYKSVQSIMQRVQAFSQQKSVELFRRGAQDEYKFIDTALDHMIEQFHTFHKRHEEDLVYRRRHFFFEWIEGNRPLTPEKWQQEMVSLGMPHQFTTLCVAVIEINKYGMFTNTYSPHDQSLLKFILSSVVKEIAETKNVAIWSEWTANDQLTVLYQIKAVSREENPESIVRDLSEKLHHWVAAYLDFGITVGIGSSVDRIELVHDVCEEALKALQYKPSLGQENVIGYWQIPPGGKQQSLDLIHYIRAEAYSLRTGKGNRLEHFEQLFAEIRSGIYMREELANLISYMIFFLDKEIMELPADVQELWTSSAVEKLHKAAANWDSLDELQQELRGILMEFANEMEALRETKSNYALIRQMKVYLEEHYPNPDLSLLHLSDAFDFQMKNISRLFKEEIGENFIDYLSRIRIERAKELLLETDCSIQEITIQVGYLHPNTFIRSFKKLAGQTPGDYRKDARTRLMSGKSVDL